MPFFVVVYLGLMVFLGTTMAQAALNNITHYQRAFFPAENAQGQGFMVIRTFEINDQPSFLWVNPETLMTQVVPAASGRLLTESETKSLQKTRYVQQLDLLSQPPYPLEDKGIKHAWVPTSAKILTVDLCPSSKPFAKAFFEKLVSLSIQKGQPFPVALSISGLWIKQHHDEFQWLVQQAQAHHLSITWVNHSFSHPYVKGLSYAENFLLMKDVDPKKEVLETERILLTEGETPSVFFRFPGLVSNEAWVKRLRFYGLLPLSADAWLAKEQAMRDGSIVLVHGNGNEPLGIRLLMPLLDQNTWIDL